MTKYLAIDFETANPKRDSACAVGLVLFNDTTQMQSYYTLIRPPSSWFKFSHVHGITWPDVKREKPFKDVWAHFAHMIKAADYFVAHNAPFDRSVLRVCCFCFLNKYTYRSKPRKKARSSLLQPSFYRASRFSWRLLYAQPTAFISGGGHADTR